VVAYFNEGAEVAKTGAATDERSFYPPLNRLLGALGELATPRITPVLAKWLAYRLGTELTGQDLDEFTSVARRIAALIQWVYSLTAFTLRH